MDQYSFLLKQGQVIYTVFFMWLSILQICGRLRSVQYIMEDCIAFACVQQLYRHFDVKSAAEPMRHSSQTRSGSWQGPFHSDPLAPATVAIQ